MYTIHGSFNTRMVLYYGHFPYTVQSGCLKFVLYVSQDDNFNKLISQNITCGHQKFSFTSTDHAYILLLSTHNTLLLKV